MTKIKSQKSVKIWRISDWILKSMFSTMPFYFVYWRCWYHHKLYYFTRTFSCGDIKPKYTYLSHIVTSYRVWNKTRYHPPPFFTKKFQIHKNLPNIIKDCVLCVISWKLVPFYEIRVLQSLLQNRFFPIVSIKVKASHWRFPLTVMLISLTSTSCFTRSNIL